MFVFATTCTALNWLGRKLAIPVAVSQGSRPGYCVTWPTPHHHRGRTTDPPPRPPPPSPPAFGPVWPRVYKLWPMADRSIKYKEINVESPYIGDTPPWLTQAPEQMTHYRRK